MTATLKVDTIKEVNSSVDNLVLDSSGNVTIGNNLTVTGTTTQTGSTTFTAQTLFPDGSVSAPSISNTGDVNTGVYFPAADNVAIATGGVAALTADSSQNVSVTNTLVMGSSFKRNRIINGDMRIWQRGTSGFASAALVYSADRWFTVNAASAVAQSSDVPTGFQYSINYASSTATFPYVAQRIEDINISDLAGKTVTFSFWAKNVSGTSNLYIEAYYPTAVNNYTSVTNIFSNQLASSPSSSWTYYTYSATLPSQVSNGMEIRIIRNNVSTASTLVTGVQVEEGSVATPYERQIYSDQLAQCQRYFIKYGSPDAGTTYPSMSLVVWYSSTRALATMTIPVAMRTTPTLTNSNYKLWVGANPIAVPTGINTLGGNTVSAGGMSCIELDISIASGGGTSGQCGQFKAENNTSANVTLSAEL